MVDARREADALVLRVLDLAESDLARPFSVEVVEPSATGAIRVRWVGSPADGSKTIEFPRGSFPALEELLWERGGFAPLSRATNFTGSLVADVVRDYDTGYLRAFVNQSVARRAGFRAHSVDEFEESLLDYQEFRAKWAARGFHLDEADLGPAIRRSLQGGGSLLEALGGELEERWAIVEEWRQRGLDLGFADLGPLLAPGSVGPTAIPHHSQRQVERIYFYEPQALAEPFGAVARSSLRVLVAEAIRSYSHPVKDYFGDILGLLPGPITFLPAQLAEPSHCCELLTVRVSESGLELKWRDCITDRGDAVFVSMLPLEGWEQLLPTDSHRDIAAKAKVPELATHLTGAVLAELDKEPAGPSIAGFLDRREVRSIADKIAAITVAQEEAIEAKRDQLWNERKQRYEKYRSHSGPLVRAEQMARLSYKGYEALAKELGIKVSNRQPTDPTFVPELESKLSEEAASYAAELDQARWAFGLGARFEGSSSVGNRSSRIFLSSSRLKLQWVGIHHGLADPTDLEDIEEALLSQASSDVFELTISQNLSGLNQQRRTEMSTTAIAHEKVGVLIDKVVIKHGELEVEHPFTKDANARTQKVTKGQEEQLKNHPEILEMLRAKLGEGKSEPQGIGPDEIDDAIAIAKQFKEKFNRPVNANNAALATLAVAKLNRDGVAAVATIKEATGLVWTALLSEVNVVLPRVGKTGDNGKTGVQGARLPKQGDVIAEGNQSIPRTLKVPEEVALAMIAKAQSDSESSNG